MDIQIDVSPNTASIEPQISGQWSVFCANNMSLNHVTPSLTSFARKALLEDRIQTTKVKKTKDSPYNSEGSVSNGSVRLDILGKGWRGGGLMSVLRMVVGLRGGQDGLLMTRGTRSGHH